MYFGNPCFVFFRKYACQRMHCYERPHFVKKLHVNKKQWIFLKELLKAWFSWMRYT